MIPRTKTTLFTGAGLLAAALLLLSGCAADTPAPTAPSTPAAPATPKAATSQPAKPTATPATARFAEAQLASASDSGVTGTVEFSEGADGAVTVTATIKGATPGLHAWHIHEKGDCSAPDGSSAGGHWNPHGHPHGPQDGEHHAGDLGNIEVDADGRGTTSITTSDFNLKPGDPHSAIGKSIIVHESVDDFKTQPTGNAGARIACGVIEAK